MRFIPRTAGVFNSGVFNSGVFNSGAFNSGAFDAMGLVSHPHRLSGNPAQPDFLDPTMALCFILRPSRCDSPISSELGDVLC